MLITKIRSDLYDAIRRLESRQPHGQAAAVPLQFPAIDSFLSQGGLRRGAVHEVLGPDDRGDCRGDGALMGFASVLLHRFMDGEGGSINGGVALWCSNRRLQHQGHILPGHVYAPALAHFGLPVGRFLFVWADNDRDTLWAAEEALRSRGVIAVVAESGAVPRFSARRLQLACQHSGAALLLLRPDKTASPAGFVETRWRVCTTLAAPGLGAYWQVSLLRARGKAGGQTWTVRCQNGRLQAGIQILSPPSEGRPELLRRLA